MRKKVSLILIAIIFLSNILISAIELDVSENPVKNAYILELDEPAVYEFTIRNLGDSDIFEIYSIVGVEFKPSQFYIASGETKTIEIKLTPQDALKISRNAPFIFQYKIKDSKNQAQEETLSLWITDLASAFAISPQNINPNSESAIIFIRNNLVYDFENITLEITSAFFEHKQILYLKTRETKEIEIPIDKQKQSSVTAGDYLINTRLIFNNKKTNIKSQMKFLEQEGIETSSSKEGFIIRRTEITQKNIGNTKKYITISDKKSILSSIFTYSNIPPTKTETKGFKKFYFWEKELIPGEELKIIQKTNWFIPIIVLIIIFTIIRLAKKYAHTHLTISKRVSFVKTKGGQFALKVSLKVNAKEHIERIKIIDKLPALVELYDKFGAVQPDKIDIQNKRLEWNILSLNKGETRILTYIIYSKIGVVGRFELPHAKVIYERDGKINEAFSNRSFYINEPRE